MSQDFDAVVLHLCETLLTTFSFTAALQVWCELRGLGSGNLYSVVQEGSGNAALPATGVDVLQPREGEHVRHRAITLTRGDIPLLDADNWYIPDRLPVRARMLLDTTDTPFGAALAGSLQNRETFEALLPPHIMARFGGRTHIRETRMAGDPEVPVMTARGIVTLDTVPVSFVEERIRPELVERTIAATP